MIGLAPTTATCSFCFLASEGSTVATAITVPFVVVVLALLAVFLWWRWRNGQKLAHLHKLQEHEFRPYTHFMPGDG